MCTYISPSLSLYIYIYIYITLGAESSWAIWRDDASQHVLSESTPPGLSQAEILTL